MFSLLSKWLLLLLLLQTRTCLLYAQVTKPGVSYEELDADIGITYCHNEKVHSFVLVGLDSSQEAIVKTHELKHQEQYLRFRDCESFQRWYHTPEGWLNSEAEAYMAGTCVAIARGSDPINIMRDNVQKMERHLGGEINVLQIMTAMNKYNTCPRLTTPGGPSAGYSDPMKAFIRWFWIGFLATMTLQVWTWT